MAVQDAVAAAIIKKLNVEILKQLLKIKNRCPWTGNNPLYIAYHDNEWGVPVSDDNILFEFLMLEAAQAGLSWITVLKKREAYSDAFDRFVPEMVAAYSNDKIAQLLHNPCIIRNRLKIESAVKNARAFIEIQNRYGSFSNFFWSYTDGKQIINKWKTIGEIPGSTELSVKISRDLKKSGFSFAGPVIIYSFMQAVGMVNDHLLSCFRHRECSLLQ